MRQNRIGKLCIAVAVTILLVMSSCLCAFAAVPDLTRKCSVTFNMAQNGTPIPGGSLKMYRIAAWTSKGGAYTFEWTKELADSGLDLNDYGSEVFARRIFMLVESRSLPAVSSEIGDDGVVTFSNLDSGLYVVYQTEPAKGYQPINAFCVSLPMSLGDTFVYDLQASPKPRPEKPDESYPDVTTPDVTTPGSPAPEEPTTVPGEPTTNPDEATTNPYTQQQTTTPAFDPGKSDDRLPQTGQLWWPAWFIGGVGTVLLGFGLTLCVVSRRDPEDSEE